MQLTPHALLFAVARLDDIALQLPVCGDVLRGGANQPAPGWEDRFPLKSPVGAVLAPMQFSKPAGVAPPAILPISAAVPARSSGWTKSRKGRKRKSSGAHPRQTCHAGLTRSKRPSRLIRHPGSCERAKKRTQFLFGWPHCGQRPANADHALAGNWVPLSLTYWVSHLADRTPVSVTQPHSTPPPGCSK